MDSLDTENSDTKLLRVTGNYLAFGMEVTSRNIFILNVPNNLAGIPVQNSQFGDICVDYIRTIVLNYEQATRLL